MNSYKKKINRHRDCYKSIIAFSKKIQKAMKLSNKDLKIVFQNDIYWSIPGYAIKTGRSPGNDCRQPKDILIVVSKDLPRFSFPTISNLNGKTENEIIELIKVWLKKELKETTL